MDLIKRLRRLLRGGSRPTLDLVVAPTKRAHHPRSTARNLLPDTTVRLGHYRVLEPLGRSTGGATYCARDDRQGRQVALKIVDPAAAEYPVLRDGLVTEGRVMSVQNHPNLQDVYELGEELGIPFLAVELVSGASLKSAIERRIGLKSGSRVIVQVLAGLAHLHEKRVVHRNIEPANIMVQDCGTVKIVGFDVAVRFDDSVARDGRIVGNPAYMSPEQAQGRMLDGRSDLFSIGCVLYELATGRSPFWAETVTEMLEKINTQEPEMAGFSQKAEWQALGVVIVRALQKRPDDRFVDAGAMSAALTGTLKGLRDDVLPPTQGWH